LPTYVAGRLVLVLNVHVPFCIGAAVMVAGIAILSAAHSLLTEAEPVQDELVTGAQPAATQWLEGSEPSAASCC